MLAHGVETSTALEEEEGAVGSDGGGAIGQIDVEGLKRHRRDEGLCEGLSNRRILLGALGGVRPVKIFSLQSDTIQRVDIRGRLI